MEKRPKMSNSGTTKRFKDQVYGHIELPALCVAFIDTPQFQRLRLLKQLGAGYFVFPGASHNRFEHSIGVAWLAGVLMRRIQHCQPELKLTNMDVELVQLTGLVHDLGHGPFSHLFDSNFLKPHQLTHEDMSLYVLDHLIADNDIDLHQRFGMDHKHCVQFIRDSISNRRDYLTENSFMLDVVHNARNGLDVDRLDYFERDALNTGMKSSCDVDRLFSEVRVLGNEICFPVKLAEDVMAAYRTRFTLFRQVYSHKVVKSIEFMIVDSLLLADESGEVFPWKLSLCAHTITDYCETNDDVLQQIKRSKSTHPSALAARKLVKRLETRRLYKCVGEVPNNDPNTSWYAFTESEWKHKLVPITDANKIRIELLEVNHGSRESHPLDGVHFYTKRDPDTIKQVDAKSTIACGPASFQNRVVRIFVCDEDEVFTSCLLATLGNITKT
ncbi:hypothetical protein BASA81_008107 [Batrachochytrium salamandrivorans]|nr:hypothetical protein BASA81_008107 [Batrachochytrium salamandrivorans]